MSHIQTLWDPTQNDALTNPSQWDLYHPIWAAEVQSAKYANTWVARTIQNKNAWFNQNGVFNREVEFVLTGKLVADRHERGGRFSGTSRAQIKRTIGLDERPYYVSITDEYITRQFEQVDTRVQIVQDMAQALGQRREVEALKMIAAAARYNADASENLNGGNEFKQGGNFYAAGSWNVVGNTVSATSAAAVLEAIDQYVILQEKMNTPVTPMYCVVDVDMWYQIRKLDKLWGSTTVIPGGIFGNTDITNPQKFGFSQYIGMDTPLMYNGVMIYRHNLISNSEFNENVTVLKADHTKSPDTSRAIDCRNTVGLIYKGTCAGWVDVMSTSLRAEQIPLSTEEIVTALDWIGGGTIMPECAVELLAV